MVKLPPMIGSCIVACAFTRHVFFGSFEGKKTVKPRFASTSDQSEIVLGVPGATVAVVVTVAVIPGVGLTVIVVAGVATAPSSRKSIDGFPHQ